MNCHWKKDCYHTSFSLVRWLAEHANILMHQINDSSDFKNSCLGQSCSLDLLNFCVLYTYCH